MNATMPLGGVLSVARVASLSTFVSTDLAAASFTRSAAIPDDSRILSLFREWIEARRAYSRAARAENEDEAERG